MKKEVRPLFLPALALVAVVLLATWWTARRAPAPPPADDRRADGNGAPSLTVVRLRGDARARGLEHGRALRTRIHAWVDRVLPQDEGSRDFVVQTAGARMGPLFPTSLRDELHGIAAGAGVGVDALLYLNTRFELEAHGLGVAGPSYAETGVAAGDEIRRGFPAAQVEDLVLFVHERADGPVALLAFPGMVGAFVGFDRTRAVVGTADDTSPVLKALPWPVIVRLVLEGRLAGGDAAPGPISRPVSVAVADRRGGGGVWNFAPPAEAIWHPGAGGPLATSFVPVRGNPDVAALFRLDARALGARPPIRLARSGSRITGRCGRLAVSAPLPGPG